MGAMYNLSNSKRSLVVLAILAIAFHQINCGENNFDSNTDLTDSELTELENQHANAVPELSPEEKAAYLETLHENGFEDDFSGNGNGRMLSSVDYKNSTQELSDAEKVAYEVANRPLNDKEMAAFHKEAQEEVLKNLKFP